MSCVPSALVYIVPGALSLSPVDVRSVGTRGCTGFTGPLLTGIFGSTGGGVNTSGATGASIGGTSIGAFTSNGGVSIGLGVIVPFSKPVCTSANGALNASCNASVPYAIA